MSFADQTLKSLFCTSLRSLFFSGSNFSQNQGEGSDQFSGGSEDAQTAGMVPSGPSAPPIPPPESTVAMGHPTGPPMPQSPPGLHPPHGFPMPPPIPPGQPPPFYVNRPNMNPPMNMQRPPPFPPDLQMLQNLFPFPPMGQNPVDFFRNFLGNQAPQGGQCSNWPSNRLILFNHN